MVVVDAAVYKVDHCAVHAAGHSIDEDRADAIAAEVRAILRDDKGIEDAYGALADLAKTDFHTETLQRVLAAPDSYDEWRVGEALAEHHLVNNKSCSFPWPDCRSTRNPNSSGGGVDLIGFEHGERVRFVFAEVKTSHQQAWPPSVLTSRSHGLHAQLTGLNAGDQRSEWAIRYLAMNGNGRPWFDDFRSAVRTYLADKLDVVIYGLLVHVAAPNQDDLQGQAVKLSKTLKEPTTMELVAIYLPAELLVKIADAAIVIETAA
ncbi:MULTISPECIES: hypothetical protein [Mycobacteriaceae]|uniref:hypothetical protein n=1 Tax=Mycolicibacterium TaxID=1866885 RepID=UPI000AABAB74|nr:MULTISPECIES: hypothetical protein [Mycolicibacterium]MCX8560489.1 hypothetical protein [Mycolicibacterium mucogenicum]UCZ58872.1 hypothetical protein LHJ73_19110 [Mycolicibacterium phocaicum]